MPGQLSACSESGGTRFTVLSGFFTDSLRVYHEVVTYICQTDTIRYLTRVCGESRNIAVTSRPAL